MSARSGELAVLGGSFDPPHFGHIVLAVYALSIGNVDRVLVAPTFEHAFGKPLTDFDHRLRMCVLAFEDLARVEISAIERELGGTSRTLRLVETLAARFPQHALRLLIGADILAEAHRFHRFDAVQRQAPLLVAGRSGHPHPEVDPRALVLPEVSSSQVREALARGEEPHHWVPPRVLRYIAQHGLYRASP